MAHYAFLDENNVVTQVIVGIEETETIDGKTPEQFYAEIMGQPCLRTSYNGKIRKNYAGIGYTYDSNIDAFVPPKCHDEATVNTSTALWDCQHIDHFPDPNPELGPKDNNND